MRIQHTIIALLLVSSGIINCSCRKLIEIPPPVDSITTLQVFSNNKEAEMAMAGVYSYLANGVDQNGNGIKTFSSGFVTILAGLSAGEFYHNTGSADYYPFSANKLTYQNSYNSYLTWASAYTIIYSANSIIEGIEASTSVTLIDSVRKELTGEAKFIRAFSYFYLVNLYGDVPLVLTIDFNKTANLPRAPHADVYTQMIKDLKDAIELLPADYSVGGGERIRVNKYTAMALLSRVYLYTGDHTNAAALSAAIINQPALFKLENDLNNVFLTGSRESIWQLGTTTMNTNGVGNATLEGFVMVPYLKNTGTPEFALSAALKNAFEPADQRWVKWTNSTDNSASAGSPQPLIWYPYKYKMYGGNSVVNGPAVERVAPFRLAEQYLIRAEAIVNGAPGTLNDAIDDLNAVRNRAGLLSLPYTLTNAQVTAAIAQERQLEFFAEFGHRWFDLKRTGRAHDVLITNPLKLPWDGDHQLLYPIPRSEILRNHFLIQTPGY